jgi:hypothetical protein
MLLATEAALAGRKVTVAVELFRSFALAANFQEPPPA